MCQKNHTSDDFGRLLTNLIDSSECYHDGRYLGRCYLSELLDAALAIQGEIKSVYEKLREESEQRNQEIRSLL